MSQKEDMIILTVDLKYIRSGQIYVIIVKHTYLLKEL